MKPGMTKRLTKAQAKAKRLREEQERAKLAKALRTRAKPSDREISVNTIPTYEYDDPVKARTIPSATPLTAPPKRPRKVCYDDDPEMAHREALAQKEKDKKRKRLAPAYNKGPVMYITDGADPAELGRKI